jgi:CRISPR-associated protein Csd1
VILEALNRYYERLRARDNITIAPEGFAAQSVGFAVRLNGKGEFLEIRDLRKHAAKGEKLVPVKMILPNLGKTRSMGIAPNFLWDNPMYLLGLDTIGKPELTKERHAGFRAFHEKLLGNIDLPEAQALLAFLQNPVMEDPRILERAEELTASHLVFQVGNAYTHDIPALKDVWVSHIHNDAKAVLGVCLATGKKGPIARLHMPVKGVAGARSTGASLSSFNPPAFTSFGKEQNLNAPVSKAAAFGYVTGLNYMLSSPAQRLRLGEATVVCWTEEETPLEENLFSLIDGKAMSPGRESAGKLAEVLKKLGQGFSAAEAWGDLDPHVRTHVLALKPSSGRLSIPFYIEATASELLERITEYYADLEIVRTFADEPPFPSVWQIAAAVLSPGKNMDDIRRLGEDIVRAALSGRPLPACLLPMCIKRISLGDSINSVKAGLLKAVLIKNHAHKENLMTLNPEHSSQAYQLGRLFSFCEGVQRLAVGKHITNCIRKQFFAAASVTPARVFPFLLRNAQIHILKARANGYDKLIRSVFERISDGFPAHLNLEDQGLFVLGYYHQRADGIASANQQADYDDETPEDQ